MSKMGAITININDKVEKEFRKLARNKYDKEKDYLGKALEEAVKEWTNRKTSEIRVLELLERGLKLGEIRLDRGKLHER